MDILQGDALHAYKTNGKVGGTLTVLSTGRHKHCWSGRKVSTCTVCVPEYRCASFQTE